MTTPKRGRPSLKAMIAYVESHPGFASWHWEDDGCFQDDKGNDLPGLWVYCKQGWLSPDSECGTIHESNWTTAYKLMKDVVQHTEESYHAERRAGLAFAAK
jgi:hypothetical protein